MCMYPQLLPSEPYVHACTAEIRGSVHKCVCMSLSYVWCVCGWLLPGRHVGYVNTRTHTYVQPYIISMYMYIATT